MFVFMPNEWPKVKWYTLNYYRVREW